jgi:hypothetical protein
MLTIKKWSAKALLSGGSAPLKIHAFCDVDNSWANVGIGLVNEKPTK